MSRKSTRKKYLEEACVEMYQTAMSYDGCPETYLGEPYGSRRQNAIQNYLDRAERELRTDSPYSILTIFTRQELMPVRNYNEEDRLYELTIGAAVWMLDQLRASGKLTEAYGILPKTNYRFDVLPIDFYHFGKSTTPDQLDQTWVNCLNLFGVEYNA